MSRLLSARFSGHSQSFDALEWTLQRLIRCIAEDKPITVTFCFGAYKNHQSPAFPEVDWAELFHLNYLISYLWPLISSYAHGIILEYESEEVSIQYNNVPQQYTDRYTTSFRKLLKFYSTQLFTKYGEKKLELSLTLARDYYPNSLILDSMISSKIPHYEQVFGELTDCDKRKWLQRAESNFMFPGTVNYSNPQLTSSRREELLREARVKNEAFLEADYELRQEFFEDPYRIPIVGTWGRMPSAQPIHAWIHLKSTTASLVDFWIGTGVVEFPQSISDVASGKYREVILSRGQLDAVKPHLQTIDVDCNCLTDISPNFASLPAYREGVTNVAP